MVNKFSYSTVVFVSFIDKSLDAKSVPQDNRPNV